MARPGAAVVGAVAVCVMLGGCVGSDQSRYDWDPAPVEYLEPEPSYEPPPPEPWTSRPQAHPGRWSCTYDPTMNEDWHDDVVCSNGQERHRPYLLADDSFITYEEIMAAARVYEDELNAADTAEDGGPRWTMGGTPSPAEPATGGPGWTMKDLP